MKRAVVNVRSIDNACFAWSVVAALHPVERNSERQYSYPDYASVLNLKDIKFPMTVNQIKTFYTNQRHRVFNIIYYVHCSYNDSLSFYFVAIKIA